MDFSNVFWLDDDLIRFGTVSGDLITDVTIIGAGITGLTAAKVFAEAGVSCTVLEKRLVGTGASSRNAGFVITGPVEHYARAVSILGREKALRLWRDSIKGIEIIRRNLHGCDELAYVSEGGSLLLAASEQEDKETEETALLLKEDGIDCDYLTADKTAERIGSTSFFGSCLIRENFGFYPYKYIKMLARDLMEYGSVQVFENSEVTAVKNEGSGYAVECGQNVVRSQMVLLAGNAWAATVMPYFSEKIIPVRGQVIATEPLDLRIWNELIYANFGFEYFRQLPDNRLLIGGWRENMPGGDAFHYNENIDERAVQGLLDYIKSNFPKLPELKVSHAWAGTMGFSRDGLPFAGPLPGRTGMFCAAGYTGHGMAFGSAMGDLTARAMLGELKEDISMYYPSRLKHQ